MRWPVCSGAVAWARPFMRPKHSNSGPPGSAYCAPWQLGRTPRHPLGIRTLDALRPLARSARRPPAADRRGFDGPWNDHRPFLHAPLDHLPSACRARSQTPARATSPQAIVDRHSSHSRTTTRVAHSARRAPRRTTIGPGGSAKAVRPALSATGKDWTCGNRATRRVTANCAIRLRESTRF